MRGHVDAINPALCSTRKQCCARRTSQSRRERPPELCARALPVGRLEPGEAGERALDLLLVRAHPSSPAHLAHLEHARPDAARQATIFRRNQAKSETSIERSQCRADWKRSAEFERNLLHLAPTRREQPEIRFC